MKNLFYVIGSLGFGYISYLNIKYGGGGYGYGYLIAYQLLGSLPFIGFWIYFLFKKKTSLNIVLNIVSFILFTVSWVLTISILKSIK
ncbi:hypothetical protein JMN32_14790 [Fulvivirga sp. 29W222]|uniref:Uncharacterized protein n=1 Tax=Fulvivirga marina TaxID=2494733 RepID=A0A937FYZ9_9BACT|nr:hypothetical protein [Fulvivirga marina]MBL6447583.1 hypothetical protein [Fulvivirga marina]